jgi:hypothetical protein
MAMELVTGKRTLAGELESLAGGPCCVVVSMDGWTAAITHARTMGGDAAKDEIEPGAVEILGEGGR